MQYRRRRPERRASRRQPVSLALAWRSRGSSCRWQCCTDLHMGGPGSRPSVKPGPRGEVPLAGQPHLLEYGVANAHGLILRLLSAPPARITTQHLLEVIQGATDWLSVLIKAVQPTHDRRIPQTQLIRIDLKSLSHHLHVRVGDVSHRLSALDLLGERREGGGRLLVDEVLVVI